MRKNIYVIINGKAGKAGRSGVNLVKSTIENAFRSANNDVSLEFGVTECPLHATELASEAAKTGNYEAICAAGGDGTVNEVMNGLVHTEEVMGILPWGSGNVFAQEMNISSNIEEACRLILTGNVRKVDTAQADNRYFLWMMGIGVEATIAVKVNAVTKKRFGVLAYITATARTIFKKSNFNAEISIDKEQINNKSFNVIIGNAVTVTDKNTLNSFDNISDETLDLLLFRKKNIGGILGLLYDYLRYGKKNYYRKLKPFNALHRNFKTLSIKTTPPMYYHIDGEIMGKTPVKIEVHPSSLNLILPDQQYPCL